MNAERSGPFGGLSASEAGRKSWEKRRERQAAEEAESNGVVVTAADTDAIIRSLRDKAKAGDLGAARELREWVEIRKEDEAPQQRQAPARAAQSGAERSDRGRVERRRVARGVAAQCFVLGTMAPSAIGRRADWSRHRTPGGSRRRQLC
jgi:hypothetical protein